MTTSIPCGIANLGNTCFLNSCVQILNNIDEMKRAGFFANLSADQTNANECDTKVAEGFVELCNVMSQSRSQHTAPVINPGKFVHCIHHVAQQKGRELFTGWAQNDLHEFLLFIIECMHNSRKRAIRIGVTGSAANKTDELALQCYTLLKQNYETGDYSEFSELFQGVCVSRLYTPDGAHLHSTRPEIYSVLDLSIPLTANRTNIYDCFDAFVGDEILTGWENETTGKQEPVLKNLLFWNFPKILIVAFKRYSPDGQRKNEAFVDFPIENLDLSKYVVGYKAASYKYDLFGVANHMGGVNGGHYTAFSFSTLDNKWFCYNDANVNEIGEHQVVSPSAYCVFYRRR